MIKIIVNSLLAILFCGPVFACIGVGSEDHHFPSCTIPLPEPNERVSVITGSGLTELSDHYLADPNRKTRLITVHIDNNSAQNYLVLSAYEQTIWQFTGDVESVSRVVVLGANLIGPSGAGVIGIPESRVSFTSPDLTALDDVMRTSCTRVANACTPAQWFGEELGERTSFHPESTQPRQRVDETVTRPTRQGDSSLRSISIVPPELPDAMISVLPELVVSQNPAQPYEVLPGRPGLEALVESGALMLASSDEGKHIILAYAEAFSARYQSRFDPSFLFIPTVDYIVMREITLPPELPPTALMVASGVPVPTMNGNRGYSVCLYFEEQAEQPVTGPARRSNLCRLRGVSLAVPDGERDILGAAASFDQLNAGSQDCQMVSFVDDTHIAAVALSEGQFRRNRRDPIRQINVEVRREGPTVLFLSMEGGPVRWNISGPQVLAVYSLGDPTWSLTEVVLNGQPYEYTRLHSSNESCPRIATVFPSRLGPSIAQLDEMFELLTAQRIDQLITFTDSGRAWRNPDWSEPVHIIE